MKYYRDLGYKGNERVTYNKDGIIDWQIYSEEFNTYFDIPLEKIKASNKHRFEATEMVLIQDAIDFDRPKLIFRED